MAEPEIQIVSDTSGKPTAVIVPMAPWRDIESERQAAYLFHCEPMRRRLLAAKERPDGIDTETAVEKLGV